MVELDDINDQSLRDIIESNYSNSEVDLVDFVVSFKEYDYIYKLKVSGQIAGVAIVDDSATEPTPTPERFQDIPHINGIFVKEEQRQNGFGKLLLDTLCKEENIESVEVDAETELTEFYAKTYPHIVYIKGGRREGI